MPNLRKLETALHRYSQKIGVNFRQLRIYGGEVISPNPTVKENPDLRKRWADAVLENETLPYFEVYLSLDALANASIDQSMLAVDSLWEMSEDNGATWHEIRIFVEPIQQSARWAVAFVGGERLTTQSPYKGKENLFLSYRDDFGTDQTLSAWVGQDLRAAMVDDAIVQETLKLKGRIVEGPNDRYIPVDLPIARRIEARLVDATSGYETRGEFTPNPIVPDKYPSISRLLGSKISGRFLAVGSGRG